MEVSGKSTGSFSWLISLVYFIVIYFILCLILGTIRPITKTKSGHSVVAFYFPGGLDFIVRKKLQRYFIQLFCSLPETEGIIQDLNLNEIYEGHVKSGKLVAGNIWDLKFVFIADPKCIQHFLAKNFENYVKPPIIKDWVEFLGSGIFTENGEIWSTQRKIARPHFQKDQLDVMVPTFLKHGKEVLDVLEDYCVHQTEFDIQNLFLSFTLDSVGEILFGYNIDSLHNPKHEFARAFNYVQDVAYWRALFPLWRFFPDTQYKHKYQVLNNFTLNIVKSALQDPQINSRTDLLARFINLEGSSETKATEYLRDMLMNFLIAGRDTTGTLLTWFFYFLSRHPEVEAKVIEEIDRVIGNELPTPETARQLKYTKQVINETLRLCPSVPVDFRASVSEDVLPSGFQVAPNTIMAYSAYVVHRLEEFWGADALKFNPERWNPENAKNIPQFAFVPFHAGPRICLGQNMAYLEARILIALILQNFRLKFVPNQRIEHRPAIVLLAKYGIKMKVEKREKKNLV